MSCDDGRGIHGMKEEVEELKQHGNQAWKRSDFAEALKFYSQAIERAEAASFREGLHLLLGNRCLALMKLGRFEESMRDSEKVIEMMGSSWEKGWYLKVKSLQGLGRFQDAVEVGLKLEEERRRDNDKTPLSRDMNDLLKMVESSSVDAYYVPLLNSKRTIVREGDTKETSPFGSRVAVRYINPTCGKGVVSLRNFKAKELVFQEEPIVSHRIIDLSSSSSKQIKACSMCWKSHLSSENLGPLKGKLESTLTRIHSSESDFLHCSNFKGGLENDCAEVYCSIDCRKRAWTTYHCLLCPQRTEELEEQKNASTERSDAIVELNRLALLHGRTNPFIISRAFSTALQSFNRAIKEKQHTSIKEKYRPFSNFVANEEPSPGDERIVQLLQIVFKDCPGSEELITLSSYRMLNGALLRNASHGTPLSEIHVHLASMVLSSSSSSSSSPPLLTEEKEKESLVSLLWTPGSLDHLCFSVSGLFETIDSMNHSCEPNIMITSSETDHRLTAYATRDIKSGEELKISYLNEEAPYQQRRAHLKKMYLFECSCPKCLDKR